MKIDKRIKVGIEAIIVAFLVWAVIGITVNSKQVESFVVTLKPDGIEHKDKVVLGMGKNEEAADYNLRVRLAEYTENLGTYADTFIGDGLEFTPAQSIPTRSIREVILLDQDKIENDVLERGLLKDGEYSGNNYLITMNSEHDLESGFLWFFATPVGIAILAGITIGIAVVVLSHTSFFILTPRESRYRISFPNESHRKGY